MIASGTTINTFVLNRPNNGKYRVNLFKISLAALKHCALRSLHSFVLSKVEKNVFLDRKCCILSVNNKYTNIENNEVKCSLKWDFFPSQDNKIWINQEIIISMEW